MDLKSKVKDMFFTGGPEYKINTNKMAIVSFLAIFVGVLVYELVSTGFYLETIDIYSLVNGLIMGMFFTSMVYLVGIAIEDDMFGSKNAERVLDWTVKLAAGVGIVSFALLFISDWGIFSVFSAIAFAVLIFLFGQILAVCIENGISINKDIAERAENIVLYSFLAILSATLVYQELVMEWDIIYFSIFDAAAAIISGVVFTIPVILIVYSLVVYTDNGNVQLKSGFRHVMFDDVFSMDMPESRASLPDYGLQASGPIDESFGQVRQWMGSDLYVRHFTFKDENVKNEIMASLNNPEGAERITNNRYIVHKDASGLFKVFNFKANQALNLSGRDLKLLIQMMDSVRFMNAVEKVENDVESNAESDVEFVPLKEKGAILASSPVCDVCNKALDVDKSFFVTKDVFYSSQKYKDWIKGRYSLNDSDLDKALAEMEKRDTSEGSAICESCIDLFK